MAATESTPARSPLRELFIDVSGIAVLALLALCIGLRWTGIRQIHINGANDQAGYILGARALADTGHISGHLIYPSTLLQPATKSVFYMPGFYACLAASYRLFGFGTFQSLLPNLIAFIVATVGTGLMARKFYGRAAGWLAAALFVFFPPNLFFACTAMSELCVTASGTAALLAFIYLRPSLRPIVGPLLLVPPFLFRDTNAFLVLPMAVLIVADAVRSGRMRTLGKPLAFVVASVVLLGVVNASPLVAGRPTFMKAAVFDDSPNTSWSDAIAQQNLKPTAGDWIKALSAHCLRNGIAAVASVYPNNPGYDRPCLVMLLLAGLLGTFWGGATRDAMLVGAGLLILCAFCFVCAFNAVREGKGLRLLIFVAPMAVAVAARAIMAVSDLIFAKGSRWAPALPALVAVAAAIFAFPSVKAADGLFTKFDRFDAGMLSIVESLHHDDATLLAGPPGVCFPYAFAHYPVFCSFPPSNAATLELLAKKYTIGTLILEADTALTAADLARAGLKLHHQITYAGTTVTVYQRPRTGDGSERWPLPPQVIPPEFLQVPQPPAPRATHRKQHS